MQESLRHPNVIFPIQLAALAELPLAFAVVQSHLWGAGKEAEKAEAEHCAYGRVYMVGRRRGEPSYKFLRNLNGRLEEESTFEVTRMAWR